MNQICEEEIKQLPTLCFNVFMAGGRCQVHCLDWQVDHTMLVGGLSFPSPPVHMHLESQKETLCGNRAFANIIRYIKMRSY